MWAQQLAGNSFRLKHDNKKCFVEGRASNPSNLFNYILSTQKLLEEPVKYYLTKVDVPTLRPDLFGNEPGNEIYTHMPSFNGRVHSYPLKGFFF